MVGNKQKRLFRQKWSKFDKCRCFLGLKIIFNIIIYKYFAIKSKHAMNYVQRQNRCQYQTNCNYNFIPKPIQNIKHGI